MRIKLKLFNLSSSRLKCVLILFCKKLFFRKEEGYIMWMWVCVVSGGVLEDGEGMYLCGGLIL